MNLKYRVSQKKQVRTFSLISHDCVRILRHPKHENNLLNKIKFLSRCLSKWGEARDNLPCASPHFYFRFFPLLRERTAKARCALRSPSRTARRLLRGWRDGEAAQKREKGVSDGHSFSAQCSRPSLTPLSRRGVLAGSQLTKFRQLRTSERTHHNPPSHPN